MSELTGRPPISEDKVEKLFSAFANGYRPPQAAIVASVHRNTALHYYHLFITHTVLNNKPRIEKMKNLRGVLIRKSTLEWIAAEALRLNVPREQFVAEIIESARSKQSD